jgi:hypothetical protein
MLRYKQFITSIILVTLLAVMFANCDTQNKNDLAKNPNLPKSEKNFSSSNDKTEPNSKAKVSLIPDKKQAQIVIDKYIENLAEEIDASEYKEARTIVHGNLDEDGDEDIAVQFTLEGMGGSNNHHIYLAIFENKNSEFTPVLNEIIGGKNYRGIESKQISNGKILLDTKDYAEKDGACCPSIEGKTSYVLKDRKLVEEK